MPCVGFAWEFSLMCMMMHDDLSEPVNWVFKKKGPAATPIDKVWINLWCYSPCVNCLCSKSFIGWTFGPAWNYFRVISSCHWLIWHLQQVKCSALQAPANPSIMATKFVHFRTPMGSMVKWPNRCIILGYGVGPNAVVGPQVGRHLMGLELRSFQLLMLFLPFGFSDFNAVKTTSDVSCVACICMRMYAQLGCHCMTANFPDWFFVPVSAGSQWSGHQLLCGSS